MSESQEESAAALYNRLIVLPFPHTWPNSYVNNLTATEITSVFQFGPKPLSAMSVPLSLAKSYANDILELIERFEKVTETTVERADVL